MSYMTVAVTVVLALMLAPVIGALLTGLDRKITARIQGRVGPPLLQPFYDVRKLFGKDAIALNQFQIMYAFLHLAFMMMVVLLLAMGQDMLMILFAHTFSTMALVMGGMCVRSPYSRIGSHRKMLQMLAYEPILVLMVVGIYLTNAAAGHRSFLAGDVLLAGKPLLLSLPLVFLTFLTSMAIKLEKSPFDIASSHHAHQELVKGVTLEYSGPYLAIIEITHFYETFVLFGILTMFWAPCIPVGIAIAAVCFLALIVLDNAMARLTSMWMIRFMWTVPMVLALSNIIWLYYR